MLKVRLNSTIQRLIDRRISSNRSEVATAEDEANRYLELYARAINRYNTAQKLYGRLANTDQLGYNLSGPMFTGNVFNTEDYNAATRFLTNSKFLNMTQGLGVSGTNALFQNVLTGFSENKAGLATAYQNYINALNGGAVNLETANTDLVNALMQCGFKSEESAREFIELTAHTEMTGDQIAAAGLIYQEGGNRIRIPGTNNLNGGKSFNKSNSITAPVSSL